MAQQAEDTIFAQSSAPGRAGVSVVRLSGSLVGQTIESICGVLPAPRHATLLWIREPESGARIDQALVLWFPGPASFTGEDVAELHLHGSPAVVRRIFSVLSERSGHRIAEPGEFTRRAILNGKMDIVQAEGLGDLLSAETEAQRRQAFDVLDGKLSKTAQAWKQSLMTALSLLEVSIDFSDEELPSDVLDNVHGLVSDVLRAIKNSLEGSSQAERLREGFEVAIVGPPNAGKSTLLNYLAGREAAITSARPGTTRDVIELSFDLDGIPVTFLDTAGLRSTDDEIEAIGVERALQRARNADVRIFLRTGLADESFDDLTPADDDLVVSAKSDLNVSSGRAISGKTGDGVREMLGDLSAILSHRIAGASLVAHERQRIALERAASALDVVERRGDSIAFDPELASADIHSALNALDYLIGKFDIEAVFDLIFRNFCLGK